MKIPDNAPSPIRTDASNAFANDTMSRRVPNTLRQISERNPDYPDGIHAALEQLSKQIQNNDPIEGLAQSAPDYESWQPQIEAHRGQRWQDTVWFFAETYFYRKVIEAVRWWETRRDPFQAIKDEEYESENHWKLLATALDDERTDKQALGRAVTRALWGNRIDLSFPDSLGRGTEVSHDDLLVDDVDRVAKHLVENEGSVHFIVDNAGSELTMDLALADKLLTFGTEEVIIHLKLHPTFVSDALPDDVWQFLKRLEARGGQFALLGGRLREAFNTGRLRLLPNGFWNSSYFLWQMPPHLESVFHDARLVIVKGDANYRRIVGDAIWPADAPFESVMSYFPAPLLALRALKSDPIIGLKPGSAAQLDTIDSRWRVNGKRGVAQFKA